LTELDTESCQHFCVLLIVSINNSLADFADGIHDELSKCSSQAFSLFDFSVIFPFLAGSIKEVVTPELLHHLFKWNTELFRVNS